MSLITPAFKREYNSIFHKKSLLLFLQLTFTFVVVSSSLSGLAKLVCLVILWIVTFRPFDRYEVAIFLLVSALYSAGNVMSIEKSVFFFLNPNFLHQPYYEFLMWGFYFFNAIRVLAPEKIPVFRWHSVPLAIFFSASFSISADPLITPLLTGLALMSLFYFYYDTVDFCFAGYFVLFGSLLEIIGVRTGEWGYPPPYDQAVSPWFFCLFAGSGVLCHRLALPLLQIIREKKILHWGEK